MKHGYVIVFSPDQDTPIDNLWNGSRQIPINSEIPFDNALFFENRTAARIAAGELQVNFPNQEVGVVPATFEIVAHIPTAPEMLPPAPPPASPAPPPGS